MDLRIYLPSRNFVEIKNVSSIVTETSEGSFGLLPQRLDCVAALVPSIFTYETESKGIHYIAVDEGILIKAGSQVMVSVRNDFGGIISITEYPSQKWTCWFGVFIIILLARFELSSLVWLSLI